MGFTGTLGTTEGSAKGTFDSFSSLFLDSESSDLSGGNLNAGISGSIEVGSLSVVSPLRNASKAFKKSAISSSAFNLVRPTHSPRNNTLKELQVLLQVTLHAMMAMSDLQRYL